MDQVKLLNITDKFPYIFSQGFTKAKQCGIGSKGLIMVIGSGYIESLILSQSLSLSNFIYLYPYYESQSILDCPNLCNYLSKIYKKEASHEEFVKEFKSSSILHSEVLNFADQIFDLSQNDSIEEIKGKLIKISYNFNIQFTIHDNNNKTSNIMKNSCINASVINIFSRDCEDGQVFYLLYHSNYQQINENNLNLSNNFIEDNEKDPEIAEIEEKIRGKIEESIKNKDILKVNREELFNLIQNLESFSSLGYEIRQSVSELLGLI